MIADPMEPTEKLWTVRDVASYLQASTSYVYKAAERGELPCLRIGSMLRFEPSAIRAFVGCRAVPGAVATGAGLQG
jgi:excisionase family DNA binding protein